MAGRRGLGTATARRYRSILALGIAVLSLGACTTVTRSALGFGGAGPDSGGPAGAVGAGAVTGSVSGPGTGPGGAGGPQGPAGGNGAGAVGSAAGPGSAGTASQLASPASTGDRPPGGTGTGTGSTSRSGAHGCQVNLGIVYSSDVNQAVAVFGNSKQAAQEATNYEAEVKAIDQRLADYVNSHGGLGPGCRIVLGYHDFHFFSAGGFTGETDSECADFAQDQHSFAVMNGTLEETEGLIPCLAKQGVVSFFDGKYFPTTNDFARYGGYLYQPDFVNPFRFGPFINLLASAGYFGSHAKVGILLADDGTGNNQYLVNTLWKPALHQLGIQPVVYTYNEMQDNGPEAGRTSSEFQSAVLQFKAAGVDHVIFTPDPNVDVFFTPQAQSQGFTPRYAMTSNEMPEWSLVPSGQRAGAMGVSFQLSDIGGNPDPRPQLGSSPASPARATCEHLYGDQTPAFRIQQYFLCDNFLLLQQALRGAPAVTVAALRAGMERVGPAFSLADSFGTARFAKPNRYDGSTEVRVAAWKEADSSWEYVTPPQTVP